MCIIRAPHPTNLQGQVNTSSNKYLQFHITLLCLDNVYIKCQVIGINKSEQTCITLTDFIVFDEMTPPTCKYRNIHFAPFT